MRPRLTAEGSEQVPRPLGLREGPTPMLPVSGGTCSRCHSARGLSVSIHQMGGLAFQS